MRKLIFIFTAILFSGLFFNDAARAAIVSPVATTTIVPGTPGSETVKSAKEEFKHLSKKEKRERIKEVKSLIRHYKAEKKSGTSSSDNTLLLCILAILLPPLAVYLHEEEINSKFWIDLLLTLLFWLPGVIYALIVVLGKD
ncbi:MAG: YqaE/Pmp3 family membrane protein [Bacteroidetes bacterium]|nr:YqaE/Pmp3 family membrane protein [Bacteroidota bacterium]MBS1631739.1 YqaE/Pmp3 family membrane protein [Bacteroidota bacterium]